MMKKPSLVSRFEHLSILVPLDDEEINEILEAEGIDADASLIRLMLIIEEVEGD
jgi:hypothetical protein